MAEADARLVERCRSRDVAAFNEIVRVYKRRVFAFVARMVPNGADAEDLTQEVFVRAFQSIGSFESRSAISTWLFRIATNLCIDHSRRMRKATARPISLDLGDDAAELEALADASGSRQDPEASVLQNELASELDKAFRGLPPKLRAVILMHDVQGMAYEEIARAVGCPLGTVKSRLFNARMAVRERMHPYLAGVPVEGYCR